MKHLCQSCGQGGSIDSKIEVIRKGTKYVTFNPFHIFLCEKCHDKMTGKPALKMTSHTPENGHETMFLVRKP